MIEPIAAVVAGPDPDKAAKNIQATTVTKPMPPLYAPTSFLEIVTNFSDMPPCSISCPAKINKGIVTKGKGSNAVQALNAISDKGISAIIKPETVAIPAAKGIGTPIIIVKTKTRAITIGPLKNSIIKVSLSNQFFSKSSKLQKLYRPLNKK